MDSALKIRLAETPDEEQLGLIMRASGMDLVSGIEDHVVITDGQHIWGGGLLFQMEESKFHLLTIAVRQNDRSRGLGSTLIRSILNDPWHCCRDSVSCDSADFQVSTVSRGKSRAFYLKNGFTECRFEDLFSPFAEQCHSCPDVATCHSAALIYCGRQELSTADAKRTSP